MMKRVYFCGMMIVLASLVMSSSAQAQSYSSIWRKPTSGATVKTSGIDLDFDITRTPSSPAVDTTKITVDIVKLLPGATLYTPITGTVSKSVSTSGTTTTVTGSVNANTTVASDPVGTTYYIYVTFKNLYGNPFYILQPINLVD
jgi:hypothetical protein